MKKHLLGALSALLGVALTASAEPLIDITRSAKFNLGVSPVVANGRAAEGLNDDLHRQVLDDLKFSRLFNLVESGPVVKGRRDAAQWAAIGSDVVLATSLKRQSNGRLEASASLFDVSSLKEILDFNTKGQTSDTRTIAHEVANEVVKYFTGQPGIFSSRIAFVNDVTGRKELYIADYDGRNARRITNDNSIVILPRISPDGQKVLFTSYVQGNPDLFVANLNGTERKKVSSKAGLNVSPSWSPNNHEVAVTLSLDGPPNIYLMDLQGKISRRITNAQGADTAPSFSPDGGQITFTSDRAGAPHIYVTNLDGTGVRRLTTVGHCDSPAWSPDGTTVLYVKSERGNKFDIYSIEVLTGTERRLTWGNGNSENPAWSPDGRFVVFVTTRRGKSELFVMMADGSDQVPLPINSGQSYTPHWSK